jgi:membrane-associated phospholipid phosphatase
MTKLFLIADGFTRAYPLIIIFSSFLNSILNNNQKELYFAAFLFISDVFNHFIKTYLFKPLFGDKKIPFFGYGTRPQKMNCGLFIDNKESQSYGFPSGHSQIAWLFTTYKILNLKGKNKTPISLFLIALATLVSYSRVKWAKCHTVQQVVFGAIIGVIIANYLNDYFNNYFEKKN